MNKDKLQNFYEQMASGKVVEGKMLELFNKLSQEAIKITMEINTKYHTPE